MGAVIQRQAHSVRGKTRVQMLVREGRWKDLRTALKQDPELLEYRDEKGRNWLHLCCNQNAQGRNVADLVKTAGVLLDAGISINEPSATQGAWKATPLWHTVAFGHNVPLAAFLLKRGSDPDHCLWAAAYSDDAQMIRLLMKSGAPDRSDEDSSPFLAAVQWGKFAAAEAFLKLGADANFQSRKKVTALHDVLAKRRDIAHVRMLVRYGARADIKDGKGVTAAEIMRRKRDPAFHELARQAGK